MKEEIHTYRQKECLMAPVEGEKPLWTSDISFSSFTQQIDEIQIAVSFYTIGKLQLMNATN